MAHKKGPRIGTLFLVRITGLDTLCFANRFEPLPQLLSLKTVRRTVFLTLQPSVRVPLSITKEKGHPNGCPFSFMVDDTGLEPVTFRTSSGSSTS